ncbi:MAG TPA: hypothetical protein VGK25_14085 [Ignavibacteria bacterium]|jgi:hypothetical protein
MVRFILYISLLFISQFSVIQCNSSSKKLDENPLTANPYFPVKHNSYWKYINEPPREESIIIEVKCKELGQAGKFELDKFPFFGSNDGKGEIEIDSKGNVFVNSGGSSLLLPEEKKFIDGYSWKYGSLNAYLTATTKQVNTEAGSFDCIYAMFTDGFTFSYEMWLAKNVGIVKWGANRTNPPTLKPLYYILKEYSEK